MTAIKENLKSVQAELPIDVRLVAISKYHPEAELMEAYEAGQRIFGESHVQELQRKHESLPGDIEWHFIGHLQTNKVKYIAPYVSLIHSVDSLKLLKEINKQGEKCRRTIPLLLQIHIAQEETKFGFTFDECESLLKSDDIKNMKNIAIHGIMCMATNTDNTAQIASEFETVHNFFNVIKQKYFANDNRFEIKSYGMSSDYPIAIGHGANLVRVGTRIFGERVY